MAEHMRLVAPWALTGVLALVLAGCTSGSLQSAAPAQTAGTGAEQASAPPDIETPSPRSGDLGIEDLPDPRELGSGWEYRVDLGNPEDGYRGSGGPATARDPASVLAAITPLGCRPTRLPMPDRALEVTYAKGEQPAVALTLRFTDETTAGRFFGGHSAVIRECSDRRRVDVDVQSDAPRQFVSTRTEDLGETPTWAEGMRLVGDEVWLIAVAGGSQQDVRAAMTALG